MSLQSSPEKKQGSSGMSWATTEASDLGEMLIDAVSRDDKKTAKTALKSGMYSRQAGAVPVIFGDISHP